MDDVSSERPALALASSAAQDTQKVTLDELLADHAPVIWRFLRRLGLAPPDAEDATQQVFMIAARKIQRIQPQHARSFLYGAALRVARNVRRGQQRRREVDGEFVEPADESDRGPEALAELAQARALLDFLLDQLAPKLRRALVLAEIEQLGVTEIARVEGIPVGTAASRLRLARDQFRSKLRKVADRNPFARRS